MEEKERKSYPSDFTDEQWEEIAPLYTGMHNCTWSKRELTDAVLYLVDSVNTELKMSIFAETKCNFSAVNTAVYTALIHHITCRLEARQALIYQLVLGLMGENGKYNYSRAVHVYLPLFDILYSAKNYKIAPALTLEDVVELLKVADATVAHISRPP